MKEGDGEERREKEEGVRVRKEKRVGWVKGPPAPPHKDVTCILVTF